VEFSIRLSSRRALIAAGLNFPWRSQNGVRFNIFAKE